MYQHSSTNSPPLKRPYQFLGVIYLLLCLFLLAFAQGAYAQQSLKGLVVDSLSQQELEEVTVKNLTTKVNTKSDRTGSFTMKLAPGRNELEVSIIGYTSQRIFVNSTESFKRIQLVSSIQQLEAAVIIGYGTVKRKDLTGSVASVNMDELRVTNPVAINQALQGKVAGVVVNQADGAPGAGISIQIRGSNSFSTSTEPLYIIDGVPFNGGDGPTTDFATKQSNNPLNLLNPKDVVSIEILKDASATAIYGSRAANGVVIVTTKSGSIGKAKVEFTSNFSISKAVKLMKVLDAATFAEYRNEQTRFGYIYDGKQVVTEANLPFPIPGRYSYINGIDPITGKSIRIDSTYMPSPDDFRQGYMNGGTNWQDQIFQSAFSQDYNLSISGGDNKGSYLFSLGTVDQQGIILNSYLKRYTIRSNFNRKITDWFEIGNNLTVAKATNRLARTNSETFGVVPSAIGFNPTRPIFNPEEPSGVSEDASSGLGNPYLYAKTAKNILGTVNIYNSAYAQIKFTDYLKFRQNLGYGYTGSNRNIYYNRFIKGGLAPINGYGSQADNYYESITSESLLMYNKRFNKLHQLDVVLGYSLESVRWGSKSISGSGFPNDITQEQDMSAALIQNQLVSGKGKSSLMSYFGRANYIFNEKYMLTATFRRDGSSRLSPSGRWSNFASAAFAWRLSDEQWIKDLNFFDLLKLRTSYGLTGNQGISAYATRSRMTSQPYVSNGALEAGFAEDRWGGPAAPNLKWETTAQYNAGLDANFFNNRVNLVVDLYMKTTKDLLQYAYIPLASGFSTVATNYGNVENKGLEITAGVGVIKGNKLNWTINGNIAFNRNKISGLDADQFSNVAWGIESVFLRRNGHAIGTLYTYQEDGFFDNEAEVRANALYRNETNAKIKSMVGQVKYKDLNSDGLIDDKDKKISGNTNPSFTYGFTNNLSYGDWNFSFFFQGSQGNDILNVNLATYDMSSIVNMPQFVWDNRWTPENKENAQFPRADNTFTRSLRASDRLIEDGSYLRLKNVSVGYRWKNPMKLIEAVNFSLSANNLFTISKYRWFDPDVNSFGGDASRRGVDMASYPTARTISFGVQVSF